MSDDEIPDDLDPRLVPGAFITDGKTLFEVLSYRKVKSGMGSYIEIKLEDVSRPATTQRHGFELTRRPIEIIGDDEKPSSYRLVRAATEYPDFEPTSA